MKQVLKDPIKSKNSTSITLCKQESSVSITVCKGHSGSADRPNMGMFRRKEIGGEEFG